MGKRMSASNVTKDAVEAKPLGRPSIYSQELADAICDRLADGKSLRAICLSEDMPSARAVHKWLETKPDFVQQYARAREAQADCLAEEIIDISDEQVTMIKRSKHNGGDDKDGEQEVVFDPTAVARNRLRVDARKWYASKLAPKKYGDRMAIGGADDMPPIRTMSDADLDAKIAAKMAAM